MSVTANWNSCTQPVLASRGVPLELRMLGEILPGRLPEARAVDRLVRAGLTQPVVDRGSRAVGRDS